MEIVRFRWLAAAVTMISLAGCTDAIEQINPTEPRVGARRFPTPHPPPPPVLKVASQPEVFLQMDDYSTTGDHVVIHNHSDGALYDLKVIVNHDYTYVMPVLQMGETVRVPDSYLRTEAGRGFPHRSRNPRRPRRGDLPGPHADPVRPQGPSDRQRPVPLRWIAAGEISSTSLQTLRATLICLFRKALPDPQIQLTMDGCACL